MGRRATAWRITSAEPGSGPGVALLGGRDVGAGMPSPSHLVPDLIAIEPTFRNGAYAAAGDVTGDGPADLVFGAGPEGDPRVRVTDGAAFLIMPDLRLLDDVASAIRAIQLANFFNDHSSLLGGVRVVLHDVDAEGRAELLGATGRPGDGRVRLTTLAGEQLQDLDPFPGASLY